MQPQQPGAPLPPDQYNFILSSDAKPKRSMALRRLANVAANPQVAILVDHYEDDWSRLWWVRLDGAARVLTDPAEMPRALDLLAARYSQYRASAPAGPVVEVVIAGVTGWSASWPPSTNSG